MISIIDTIRELATEDTDLAPESITEFTTFEAMGLDSLQEVELLMRLEDRFEIDILDHPNIETVGDLVAIITAKLEKKHG